MAGGAPFSAASDVLGAVFAETLADDFSGTTFAGVGSATTLTGDTFPVPGFPMSELALESLELAMMIVAAVTARSRMAVLVASY